MIQRYGAYGTQAEPEGEFVTYTDHAEEVARLRAAIEQAPHEVMCSTLMVNSDTGGCDCWKRAALDKGEA
jgi:hypothetical protein